LSTSSATIRGADLLMMVRGPKAQELGGHAAEALEVQAVVDRPGPELLEQAVVVVDERVDAALDVALQAVVRLHVPEEVGRVGVDGMAEPVLRDHGLATWPGPTIAVVR
jgi:hypothetical protein